MMILITGSGSGLGKHLAINFARNNHDILIHYNTSVEGAAETAATVRKQGRKAEILQADLADPDEISQMFSKIESSGQIPQVLINNAAVFPEKIPFRKMSVDYWDEVMNTNLRAQMICIREFAKIAPPESRIVNIASLGGREVWKERTAYNVSKAGLLHLTKAAASELAPEITVNSVSPVSIAMDDKKRLNRSAPEKKLIMGRQASPEEVFECVNFFVECRHFITGQNLEL